MRAHPLRTVWAGVLADDLTGGLDSGLEAWRRSLRVRVLIAREPTASEGSGSPTFGGVGASADLVVLDTETRGLDLAACRARVTDALEALARDGVPLVYKKVDSTLRGNLGGEIEALLAAGAAEAVLLAPSLPRAGRTVRGGRHFVKGLELAATEMARDPSWPIATSDVAGLLAAQSALPVRGLSLEVVRGPAAGLSAWLDQAMREGARILSADAETEQDLAVLAAACGRVGRGLLPCGSAGLFAHLGLGGPGRAPRSRSAPSEPAPRPARGPVLVVSGSLSEVSRAQLELAAKESGTKLIRPAADRLFGAAADASREKERVAAAVEEAVREQRVVFVDGASTSRAELHASCASDVERARRGRLTLEALAGAFLRVRDRVAGLVLVGGDTAVAVCRAAGAQGIEIAGEVEPLVPLGSILGGPQEGMRIATKAGGLGSARSVLEAIRSLSARG